MNLSLRAERKEDGDFLFLLYTGTRQEEMAAWGLYPEQQSALLRMQFQAQRQGYAADFPNAECQIILANGEPVGRMIVDRMGEQVRLVDIAVLAAYRNRGVGAQLIGQLIAESHASGKPLNLRVVKGNPAIRLYQRLGFTQVGEDEMSWYLCCSPR
jgi:ribosomal protein S18 acetylase RimI-like enzyme